MRIEVAAQGLNGLAAQARVATLVAIGAGAWANRRLNGLAAQARVATPVTRPFSPPATSWCLNGLAAQARVATGRVRPLGQGQGGVSMGSQPKPA